MGELGKATGHRGLPIVSSAPPGGGEVDRAAAALSDALSTRFLKALAEPVRVEIIKRLIAAGESDIGSLAAQMPQDRSVISRHLQIMFDAGLVRLRKEGRHRYYALDSGVFILNLETILERTRRLISLCCPASLDVGGLPKE